MISYENRCVFSDFPHRCPRSFLPCIPRRPLRRRRALGSLRKEFGLKLDSSSLDDERKWHITVIRPNKIRLHALRECRNVLVKIMCIRDSCSNHFRPIPSTTSITVSVITKPETRRANGKPETETSSRVHTACMNPMAPSELWNTPPTSTTDSTRW